MVGNKIFVFKFLWIGITNDLSGRSPRKNDMSVVGSVLPLKCVTDIAATPDADSPPDVKSVFSSISDSWSGISNGTFLTTVVHFHQTIYEL